MIWLIRKDLLRFFADRQGALMAVLLPVVLASLLGMLFAPRAGNNTIDMLVADADGGEAVRKFVAAIDKSSNFAIERVDERQARKRLASGDASLALVLPKGSNEALKPSRMFSGEQGHATLLYDPSDSTQADIAAGLLTQLLMQQTMRGLSGGQSMNTMFSELEGELDETSSPQMRNFVASGKALAKQQGSGGGGEVEIEPPLSFDKSAVAARGPAAGYNSYAHNFAGMLLLFLLFGGQSAAKHLVTEREGGTLLRIRLAPLRPAVILLGTGGSAMVIALITTAAVYVVGMTVFGIRVASWAGFSLMVIAIGAFVGGFALLLAGLGRTEQQINSIGSFVVLVMSLGGGGVFASFVIPEWVETGTRALATYWATQGLAAMTWRGLEAQAALLPASVLLASAALCAFIGIRRFTWR